MESMTSLLTQEQWDILELLTQEQWDILDGMRSNLGLAADLAQAKISLILPLDRSRQLCASAAKLSGKRKAKAGGDICFLSVFDQAEPLCAGPVRPAEGLSHLRQTQPLLRRRRF